jgi:hypothetical protein
MDKTQQDILWKRAHGVSHTSADKEVANEALPSYDTVFGGQVWSKSNLLPVPSPLVLPDPPAVWNGYVSISNGATAVRMRVDDTSVGKKAWVAVKDVLQNIRPDNVIMNWIPPRFHPSYKVRVWAGDPNSSTVVATRLMPISEDYEWEFDYSAGVLFFYHDVPPVALEQGIWIEGWQYTGPIGDLVTFQDLANRAREQEYKFNTDLLQPMGYVDFELPTGGSITLTTTLLDGPGTLECHTTQFRDDTNPYRFVGIAGHLADDGSYSVAGRRVFGPRFINMENLSDPYRGVTYWRVYNDALDPAALVIVVRAITRS